MADKGKVFTFTWEIENFSMLPHQNGELLVSDTFMVDQWPNVEWYLSLYPRGETAKNIGKISVFLMRVAKDLETTMTYSLTVVSSDPSLQLTRLEENTPVGIGRGFDELMELSTIYAKKELYLPNDTLTLRCCLMKADDCHKEIIENQTKSVPNFLRSCNSRTAVQVHRRSISLPVKNIKKLIKRKGNTGFVLETALKNSFNLKITLNFAEVPSNNMIKVNICQTCLPFNKERIFVKCKMTVISTHKKYQDSKESTHLFQLSLDDVWHFPEFLLTSNLTREKYLYMDDTLLLQCEFAFSYKSAVYNSETNYMPLVLESEEDRNVSELNAKLEKLFEDEKFCDVLLRSGDETIPAHKVVLCAMSPVFRAMFENGFKEKESNVVDVKDVDPDTLMKMLRFMHGGNLKEHLLPEEAIKLFSAADKYDVETLKRRCSLLLVSSLSVANVCDVLGLADAHQDHFLMSAVDSFICNHANETFHSGQWKNFMDLNPQLSGQIMHQMMLKKRLLRVQSMLLWLLNCIPLFF